MEKIELYHLDDLEVEREFGMDVLVCQRLGCFGDKVALEYVKLDPNTEFKPHYHENSDALILILEGEGYMVDESLRRYSIRRGSIAYFPRKVRHGFITEREPITFITIQRPPIKNLGTREVDFIE